MLSIHSCPLGKVGNEDTGGMSVYIRELGRELGRRGHFVDVYTRTHEPLHDQIIEIGENARLIHFRAGEEGTDKWKLYSHLDEFTRDLEDFTQENGLQYDLIHSHYWLSGIVGEKLQELWDIPHVIGFHTLGAVKNAVGIGEGEPEHRINAERRLAKDCHRIIASTEKGKEDLITYYDASPEAISVIPCGVNLDLFRPVQREIARYRLGLNGESIIVFVGRIIPLKGIDNMLKAFAHLEQKERVKVVVIGGENHDQAEMQRLKKLSRTLKVDQSVEFRGSVSQEMLPLFYSAADLCVVPSYYESFGLVILESLACGTPVVATKVGCAESVIRQGETGYVVADNDPGSIADKMSRLLSRRNGKDVIHLARASVAKYSWSNISEAIVKEYRSVLWGFSSRACKRAEELQL